jgi:glycosyltransferase involved in cell wall biosynthesis
LRDAQEQWAGRNQLLLALSRYAPVVLLEQRHAGHKVPIPSIDKIADNVFVVRNALALRTSRPGRRHSGVSAAIDGHLFRRSLRSVGIRDYVFWLTEADPVLIRGVPSRSLIYDCADPNFLPQHQASFDEAERQVAERAVLTFSTAQSLLSKMKRINQNSFLLPNATSQDFLPDQTATLPRPDGLEGIRSPMVGYLGTIDWRFDPDPVITAAQLLPDCTFAIVGRVNEDREDAVAPLRRLSNVVMPGQVDYEQGRAWVGAFDVGLIPFTVGPMNDAINPVKMYMYLMAGLPVVSTNVAECRRNPFVRAAANSEEFAAFVQECTRPDFESDAAKRTEFALLNTWEVRAHEAVALLRQYGLLQ